MKRMKSKLLAILMSLAMVFTMMPMMSHTVYADDPAPPAPGIATGTDVLSIGSNTSGAATVYCGTTAENPVAWRVIGYAGEGVASTKKDPEKPGSADTMTLIAADNLKTGVKFREDWWASDANHYGKSNLKNEIDKLTGTGAEKIFSDEEKAGIVPRDLESEGYTSTWPYTNGIAGDKVEGALLWPLSTQEATYMNNNLREANDCWWLRSPVQSNAIAVDVSDGGDVYYDGDNVEINIGVRPAFNLNLSSVLLTSAAAGGKSSGDVGAGSLAQVETNATGEWKLTVKDDVHAGFKVDEAYSCDGKNLYIKYSGAVPGDNEYISAIIKDKNDVIKYYGKLAVVSDSGKATVTFDGKMSEGDILCIFNEQCNGNYETDFSSPLWETEILYILHPFQPATCTEPETCENCGIKRGTPTGHKYGAWTKLNATQHQRVCEHDDTHVEKENHTWDAGKVTKEATTEAEGVKTFTCEVCKAEKTEAIAKLTPTTPKISGTPTAKMSAGKTSITMAWSKVEGVDGYDIFFAQCNHNKKKIVCKNVKTIEGNNIFTWKKSGLKKGTAYKSYVKAYVMKNGKKTYVKTSPMMHAYTGNGTKKYTNAKSVTVKKAKVSLKKGKTYKIKASVKKMKKNKKLMPKSHVATLRYLTSNSKVATVSKKGKITAKGKGSCVIYVFAHNGVSKQVKVTVN